MTLMIDRIALHLSAWKAFQVAPDGMPSMEADDAMTTALDALLTTQATSFDDVRALYLHLDWYAKEEGKWAEEQPLAVLATITWLAAGIDQFNREVFL